MKHISDEPVNLNEIDLLGGKKYSELLKENILKSPDKKSITIGLFGEWGSGKSSIIKTTMSDLKETNPEIKFIEYDAWKYTNDGFRRTFLMQIREDLKSRKISKKELQNRLYSNISEIKYSKLSVVSIFIGVFLIAILRIVGQSIESSLFYSVCISFSIFVLGCLIQILFNFISNASIQKLHYFSPEQFEDDFELIINESLNDRFIDKLSRKLGNKLGNKVFPPIKKIVIVIDNMDRCHQDQTYNTLTDVRGFLDNKKIPVVFVIPVDDTALSSQIQKYGDKPSEFLRKIFDAVIHIKPLKQTNLYDLVNNINERENLFLKSDTMYLIAEEYAQNPRRIVRLLSNLQEELNFFDKCYTSSENDVLFSKNHETIICKLLIIREDWPDFYNEISQNPEMLFKKTSPLDVFNWPNDSLQIEIDKRKDKTTQYLIKFLENTIAITKNVDDELIRKLTTSHNSFEEIPTEIYEQLKDKQYDKIFSYIEGNENFSLLLNYLLRELRIGKQRGAFETKVPETFDHLLRINSKKNISTYDIQIENVIGDHLILFGFFTSLNEIENLVKYTYDHKSRNPNSYLYNFVTYELNVMNDGQYFDGTFYKDLFLTFADKYPDESICATLKSGFSKRFDKILGLNYDFKNGSEISEPRIKCLISDELVDKLLNKTEQKQVQDNLIFISSFYELNSNHIKKLDEEFIKQCKLNPFFKKEGGFSEEAKKTFGIRFKEYKRFIEEMNRNLEPNNQINISREKIKKYSTVLE